MDFVGHARGVLERIATFQLCWPGRFDERLKDLERHLGLAQTPSERTPPHRIESRRHCIRIACCVRNELLCDGTLTRCEFNLAGTERRFQLLESTGWYHRRVCV